MNLERLATFILWLVVGLLVLFFVGVIYTASKDQAHGRDKQYHVYPTPTQIPTPTPCKPSPTPEITPTPEATPSATPTPFQESPENGQPGLSEAHAPSCEGVPVTRAPEYTQEGMVRPLPTTVILFWKPTDDHADRYGIFYGTSPKNLGWYTETPANNGRETSAIVNQFPSGATMWVKICSIGRCGDQICGPVVDP